MFIIGSIEADNTVFDPALELVYTKAVEMFCESIPSSVLQTFAILNAEEMTNTAVFSIICSALAIAFTSTTISIDIDIDPEKRLATPGFYGYTPNQNRLLVFGFLMFMTTGHVLMKVLACSLLMSLNKIWFALYMIIEICIYFGYKIIRNDFRYFLRVEGVLSWVASFMMRLCQKSITDFTLLVHLRHPNEAGGIYWSFNVVVNQAFCFISVYLYGKYSDETDAFITNLWLVVGGLLLFSMSNFGGFLLLIKREYWVTFYNMKTGKEFCCETWRYAKSDQVRFNVFKKHKSYYKSINKELKDWLSENWENWEEEKEDWFTAKMIGKIPDELLPEKFTRKLGVDAKGRRKSMDAMIKVEEKEVEVEKVRRASATQVVPSG